MIQDPTPGATGSVIRRDVGNVACVAYSGALSGQLNVSNGAHSTILGGHCNCFKGNSCSFIGAGYSNYNKGNLTFIGSGLSNYDAGGGCSNVIGAGVCNRLTGSFNFIGSGICNRINEITGKGVTGAFIGGGIGNNTTGGTWTGTNWSAAPTAVGMGSYSAIIGGFQNFSSSSSSFIGGGCFNGICSTSPCSVIVGGGGNAIFSCSPGSFIGGGLSNYITAGATSLKNAFIGGGYRNCIKGGNYEVIIGGRRNCIFQNCSSNFFEANTIFGGSYNNIQDSTLSGTCVMYNIIYGGGTNTILACCSEAHSTILGGCKNSISATTADQCYNAIFGLCNFICDGSCNTMIFGAYLTAKTICNTLLVNDLCSLGGGLSDCRTKTDINDFNLSPCDVIKLRPVSFCFTRDLGTRRYGFIAQEVCQIFPEAICYNELHRYYEGKEFVDKDRCHGDPLLEFDKDQILISYVGVIKDLNEKVESLKSQINEFKSV